MTESGAAEGFWQACGANQPAIEGGLVAGGGVSGTAGAVLAVQPGEQGRDRAWDRGQRSDPARPGVRVDERGTLLELRGGAEPGNQEAETDGQTTQVSVSLSLLDAPRIRVHERAYSNLVPLLDSDLPKRKAVAGAADGPGGDRLPAARQLLQLDRRLHAGATVDGRAVARELAALAGRGSQSTEPDP